MDDYIKREEAIEALGEEPYVWSDSDAEIAEHAQWVSDVKAIEAVPSADVIERKHGKWELIGTTKLYEAGLWVDDELEEKCSLCGCHTFRYETQKENNFCPNCGADMREER